MYKKKTMYKKMYKKKNYVQKKTRTKKKTTYKKKKLYAKSITFYTYEEKNPSKKILRYTRIQRKINTLHMLHIYNTKKNKQTCNILKRKNSFFTKFC